MGVFAEQEEKKNKSVKTAAQTQKTVQRDLADVNGPEGGMLPESVSAKIQSKRGTGQKLSDRNLERFSQKFGRDMSDVHVHTDAESDTISRSLNARAFTIGSDIFLTKGINPDGSGHDAQTMAHEMTHVVQQNGRAGFGKLKLGAADTAQEHEAETTAQREYSPELKEEDDTIQRGFFSGLGKMVGHNLLNMVGLEDAYNATFGAKHKVQAAVSELDAGQMDEFNANEDMINNLQEHLSGIKYNLKNDPDSEGGEALSDEYASVSSELAELREKQLKTVQEVDPSITDADMVQFRNKNTAGSMALGAIGSSIMAGFARGEDKDQARAQGMQSAVSFGAGAAAYSAPRAKEEEKKEDPKVAALEEEVKSLKEQIAAMQSSRSSGKSSPRNRKHGGRRRK